MYEASICPETMLVHDVINKENVSISRPGEISRGSRAIFYDSINHDARMCSCAVRRSLFTHPATSRTKGWSAIILLNPCNVVRPKMRVEESIFFRPFPHC